MTRKRYVVGTLACLLAAVALGGCSGGASTPGVATAESTGSATATKDGQGSWVECMRSAGVTMVRTADGNYQVDKSRAVDLDKISSATRQCQQLQPSSSVDATVSAADLARARQLSACIRAHGVPDYPDPDPQTGTAHLSDEQSARLKTDQEFLGALDACRDPGAASTGVAGG